jgi:hypothetical protein
MKRSCSILAFTLAVLTAGGASGAQPQVDRTVAFWNVIAVNTVLATPLGPRAAPLGSRVMAMMHVAMADAVTSIHPKYGSCAVRIIGHGSANKVAAAAAAAHGVLVRLFPDPQVQIQLDQALKDSLAALDDNRTKEEGLALGEEVAAQIVALRANDRSDVVSPTRQL